MMERELQKALADAPIGYWNCFTLAHEWWSGKEDLVTPLGLRDCVPIKSLPGILACGAHSSSVQVQESTRRLSRLILGSSSTYIPSSRGIWALEGVAQCECVAALLGEALALADWAQRLAAFAWGASELLRVDAVSSQASSLCRDAPPLVETLAACRLVDAALANQPVGSGFNAVRAASLCDVTVPVTQPPGGSKDLLAYFGELCGLEAWQVNPLSLEQVSVSEAFVESVIEHLPSYGHRQHSTVQGESFLRAMDVASFGIAQPAAKRLNAGLMANFPLGVPSRLLVLGAGGTGKTILVKQLILETCRASLLDLDGKIEFSPSCIPFRIPLSALVAIVDDKGEGWAVAKTYFTNGFGPHSVYAHALQHVQEKAGPGFLVLDGFDEVRGPNAGETQRRKRAVLNWIGTFDSSLVYVAVTSRPAAIEGLREAFGGLGFVARRVLPLTASTSTELLDKVAGRLGLADADRDSLIGEIQRPEYLC